MGIPDHLPSIMDRCHTNFGKDEEVLVTFLSGVNQVFLTYLFLAMACSLILEDRGSPYSPVPEDYDFELDSGLQRGAGHTTSVACMAILSVVAMMWVGCARMARNRRVLTSKSTTSPTMELADTEKHISNFQ